MATSEKDNRQDPADAVEASGAEEAQGQASAEDAIGQANAESASDQSDAEGAAQDPADAEDAEDAEAATGEDSEVRKVVVEAEAILAAAAELDEAKAEAAEWKDKYLRLHAEWDTYRRRMNDQRKEEKARATEKLMEDLLPVLDDFERTVAYADKNGEVGLLGGVQAVQNKLIDMLTKHGLQTVDPKGEAFDALEAQAVAMVDDATVPDETVAEVYQKGYRMGAKVLRPAMVTVTQGGPKRVAPEDETSEE